MTEPTYKAIELEKHTMSLLVNPGTPEQRSTWRCRDDRPSQASNAIAKTRERFPDVPLAWLLPDGKTMVPVIP